MTLEELLELVDEHAPIHLNCGDVARTVDKWIIFHENLYLDHKVISITALFNGYLDIEVEE